MDAHKKDHTGNKYVREICDWDGSGRSVFVDYYAIQKACQVPGGPIDHAVKKLLYSGVRGHKDRLQDLKDARDSILRAIEQELEEAKVIKKKELGSIPGVDPAPIRLHPDQKSEPIQVVNSAGVVIGRACTEYLKEEDIRMESMEAISPTETKIKFSCLVEKPLSDFMKQLEEAIKQDPKAVLKFAEMIEKNKKGN